VESEALEEGAPRRRPRESGRRQRARELALGRVHVLHAERADRAAHGKAPRRRGDQIREGGIDAHWSWSSAWPAGIPAGSRIPVIGIGGPAAGSPNYRGFPRTSLNVDAEVQGRY